MISYDLCVCINIQGPLSICGRSFPRLNLELDGHQPLVGDGLNGLGEGGGDGEDSLLRQGGAHQVRVHPTWKGEALIEALRGVASAVRGLLLMGRLHVHRVVDRLDHQLLRLVALNVDQYFVRVVVVLDSRDSILLTV